MQLMVPLCALLLTISLGCSAPIANRTPVGEVFPSVSGTGLDGTVWALPEDLRGAPAVLLIGFVQRSQFDIDRWILGLAQLQTPARILEVPTIPGLIPGMFADRIDGGMRRGIPEEDWPAVVTVYDDGDAIVRFTGNTTPSNARVVLVDGEGRVIWYEDRGYSATLVTRLDAAVRALIGGPQRSAEDGPGNK